MFGNSNKKVSPSQPISTPQTGSSNSIINGSKIEGTIEATNDFRIDGTLIGSLNCKGRVIIGPSGRIEGDVECNNALVEGTFIGKFIVKELLSVKESGAVQGDIRAAQLDVTPGAKFTGNCDMGQQVINNNKALEKGSKNGVKPIELVS